MRVLIIESALNFRVMPMLNEGQREKGGGEGGGEEGREKE